MTTFSDLADQLNDAEEQLRDHNGDPLALINDVGNKLRDIAQALEFLKPPVDLDKLGVEGITDEDAEKFRKALSGEDELHPPVINDERCVLAVGDAFDGLEFYGPFDNAQDATEFAGSGVIYIDGADWHVVPLTGVQCNSDGDWLDPHAVKPITHVYVTTFIPAPDSINGTSGFEWDYNWGPVKDQYDRWVQNNADGEPNQQFRVRAFNATFPGIHDKDAITTMFSDDDVAAEPADYMRLVDGMDTHPDAPADIVRTTTLYLVGTDEDDAYQDTLPWETADEARKSIDDNDWNETHKVYRAVVHIDRSSLTEMPT